MPAEVKKYPLMYFTNVNRRANPFLSKDDELLDCVNWWTEDKVGEKKVRPGLTKIMNNPDSTAVRGFSYEKFPNGNKRLAMITNTHIYAIDPNSDVSWGTAKYTLGSGQFVNPDSTVLNAKVHIVDQFSNNTAKYLEWTNTGSDSISDATYTSGTDLVVPFASKSCVTYHRRVYTGSVYDGTTNLYRSRISWSSIDYQNVGTDPASPWTTIAEDTSTADYRNIDTDYKGNILKLTNINDRLNIYKEEGVYRYNETSVFDIFGLSPYDGSICTMQETKMDFFFTNEGFFKTDGKTTTPIGEGWYPIIKEILRNGITTTKIRSGSANFIYMCYMGDVKYDGKTVSNACFVYNAYYDELTLWSFAYDMTAFGSYIDNSGDKVIVMGDKNGNTYKLDYSANDDAGVSIFANFDTRYYFFDSPNKDDQISELLSFAELGSEIQVLYDKDFNDEYKEIDYFSGWYTKVKMDLSRVGYFKTISFRVMWNGRGKRPSFFGFQPTVLAVSNEKEANKK